MFWFHVSWQFLRTCSLPDLTEEDEHDHDVNKTRKSSISSLNDTNFGDVSDDEEGGVGDDVIVEEMSDEEVDDAELKKLLRQNLMNSRDSEGLWKQI